MNRYEQYLLNRTHRSIFHEKTIEKKRLLLLAIKKNFMHLFNKLDIPSRNLQAVITAPRFDEDGIVYLRFPLDGEDIYHESEKKKYKILSALVSIDYELKCTMHSNDSAYYLNIEFDIINYKALCDGIKFSDSDMDLWDDLFE